MTAAELAAMSPDELAARCRNARLTAMLARGHSKATANHAAADTYASILAQRGHPIPDTDDVIRSGSFNGPGAV